MVRVAGQPHRGRAEGGLAHLAAGRAGGRLPVALAGRRGRLLPQPVGVRRRPALLAGLPTASVACGCGCSRRTTRPTWCRSSRSRIAASSSRCLDDPTRREVHALLAYAEDDAGGLMNPRFARVRPDMSVDEAIRYLRQQAREKVETIYYAYVARPRAAPAGRGLASASSSRARRQDGRGGDATRRRHRPETTWTRRRSRA